MAELNFVCRSNLRFDIWCILQTREMLSICLKIFGDATAFSNSLAVLAFFVGKLWLIGENCPFLPNILGGEDRFSWFHFRKLFQGFGHANQYFMLCANVGNHKMYSRILLFVDNISQSRYMHRLMSQLVNQKGNAVLEQGWMDWCLRFSCKRGEVFPSSSANNLGWMVVWGRKIGYRHWCILTRDTDQHNNQDT